MKMKKHKQIYENEKLKIKANYLGT